MTEDYKSRAYRVPSGRLSRIARFGSLTTGILGNMAYEGTRQFASGQRPRLQDLLLTPANATRLTQQLAQMRGAAMKMGQLLSMEAGEILPPELSDILAHLRADAHFMPARQLKSVLVSNWGADFLRQFSKFDVHPIAAASIGQVHRATTRDGRDLAIKVQYPGVRRAIDSDVSNVATLMRLSGLLPRDLDLPPLLDEARRQLHEEADYQREGQCLSGFARLLADDPAFRVPALHGDLTTRDILAMDFIAAAPIESVINADQSVRDRVTTHLLTLLLRELFEFRQMQTDPNFANYRYQPDTGQIVLLDFGATRSFAPALTDKFRRLLHAGLARDRSAIRAAAIDIGYFSDTTADHHQTQLLDMFDMALEPLTTQGTFDFGTTDLTARLRDAGMAFGQDRDFWEIPPMDTLFLQRKIAGLYLLAARLKARIDMPALLAPHR